MKMIKELEYEDTCKKFNIPENIAVFDYQNLKYNTAIPAIRLQSNKIKLIEVFKDQKEFDDRLSLYQSNSIYGFYKNGLCQFKTIGEVIQSFKMEFLSYQPWIDTNNNH